MPKDTAARQLISPTTGFQRTLPPAPFQPNFQDILQFGLELAPGSGEVLSAQRSSQAGTRMVEALKANKYKQALASGTTSIAEGLGAVPLLGLAMRGVKRIPPLFHGTTSARSESGRVWMRPLESSSVVGISLWISSLL